VGKQNRDRKTKMLKEKKRREDKEEEARPWKRRGEGRGGMFIVMR
jgi:hypothetical protein